MSSNIEPMILILTGEPLARVHKNEMELPGLTLATLLAARAPGPQVRSEFFRTLDRILGQDFADDSIGAAGSNSGTAVLCAIDSDLCTYPCATT